MKPDARAESSRPPEGGRASAIDGVFETLQRDGRVGLMTHIVYGYPSVEGSREIVEAMVRAGVDLIEVQLPFSDPTADGPTITAACQTALEGGARVRDGIRFVSELTRRYPVPVLFMSYFNVVFSYRASASEPRGVESFARAAAAAGVSGLIVPDIPPEETQEGYPEACRKVDLHPIYVTSPNATPTRLRAIADVGSGFVYCTSRTGTTGRDVAIAMEELGPFLARAREICRLPIAVGFSISSPEQVAALAGHADMAVVGSHLLRVYEAGGARAVEQRVRELVGG